MRAKLVLLLILAGCDVPNETESYVCSSRVEALHDRIDGLDLARQGQIEKLTSATEAIERRLNRIDPTPTPTPYPTPSRRCCCDWLDSDYLKGTAGPDFDDGRKKCQDDYMCTHYSICEGCKW